MTYSTDMTPIWFSFPISKLKVGTQCVHVASLVNFNLTPQNLPYVNYWEPVMNATLVK
jgi:hypothetical protein